MAVLKRGLLGALLGTVVAACPGVPLRPDGSPAEERCPEGARAAMEALHLDPGDSVPMDVDATRTEAGPVILYDGPIESRTWGPMGDLPGRVRLYGRAWTGGPRVVIRYYSAQLPDGRRIPFCAVAADNGPGLPKSPGRPGAAAIPSSVAEVFITGQFR